MPLAIAWFLDLSPERTAGEVGPHRHRRGVRGWPGLTAWMPSEGVSHMDVASRPVTKRDTESRGYREAARATGGAGGVGGAAASAPNPFACYRVPLSHERIANGTTTNTKSPANVANGTIQKSINSPASQANCASAPRVRWPAPQACKSLLSARDDSPPPAF